ncbi:MAG TPA: type IX secretion system membrane protein PorP/SprF [Bacteroidia bacterium]|jgi:type IX secretion system PorP/SprF family membrane protein|nr:type IX secretion system membrane protein PorP/SprF [Bacteroidia bacterium]
MKKYFLLLLTCIGTFAGEKIFAQQDPQFSQYMFNPLNMNPGYAGSRGVMNGALVYRNQWTGFDGAPTTEVLAVNAPSRKGKVGLGLEVMNDHLGPKNSTGAYLDYAYRLPCGKGKLAFGLGAGVVSYHVDWNKVTYKDAGDGFDNLNVTKLTKPDFKFGIYFNNKNFYISASTTHINREVYSMQDTLKVTMSQHSYLAFGRAFQLSDNFLFSPSIMIRSANGIRQGTADLNLNFKLKNILWFGVSVRTEKSLVAMFQYNINDKFKIGYSYDMTMSKLRTYQSGTHEIVLGFDLNLFQSQVMSPRFF